MVSDNLCPCQSDCIAEITHLRAALAEAEGRSAGLTEAIIRTRRRLEGYCNEANAGRMPSDAREFMRRVQCGFDSLMEEAAQIKNERAERAEADLAEAERERDRMTATCDCGKVSGLCQSPNECRAPITKIIMTRAERADADLAAARQRITEQSERISELYRAQKNTILSARSVEYDIDTLQANLSAAREAIEDAVDTLESMNLHIDNPLYDRLRACLERPATADAIK